MPCSLVFLRSRYGFMREAAGRVALECEPLSRVRSRLRRSLRIRPQGRLRGTADTRTTA